MRSAVLPSVLSLVLACGIVACAHDAPRPPAEDTIPADALPPPDVLPLEARAVPEAGRFVLTGIRRPVVASITEAGIQGPDVNLGRYKKQNAIEWRGTAFNQTANLSVSGSGAEGIVGRTPFTLRITPSPDGMVVNGLIGGQPSTVTISKTRINGGFGLCGYDVVFQGQAYVGPRSCGKGPIQVGVTLPPILATWSDAEVATVLALLMSGR